MAIYHVAYHAFERKPSKEEMDKRLAMMQAASSS